MIAPIRYHVTLEQITSDFERIEVIGAESLRAARSAWLSIGDLPTEVAVELRREISDLRKIVETNAMLKQESRDLVSILLRLLEDRRERIEFVMQYPLFGHLHEAVKHSQRVADLVTAERHIGKARGF